MNTESDYSIHPVFTQINLYCRFYDYLAKSVFLWVPLGILSAVNIDSFVYTSMQGTLESISNALLHGQVTDAYALLRKYYDAAVINIYTNVYLQDHFTIDNFNVQQIDNWVQGKQQLPSFRKMNDYIQKSEKLSRIHSVVTMDTRYSELRKLCNDNIHYNFYRNVLADCRPWIAENFIPVLNRFANDIENIFILHLAYIFYINDHYMMASNYVDCLEVNIVPDENAQYLVAPFIQEIFDKVIKKTRMDIALEIMRNSPMKLV